MKKIILSLVALLIASATFVSCSSSDDNVTETPQQPITPKTYTLTINASKGGSEATTRALSLSNSGSTLNATWASTDVISVYNGSTLLGTITPETSGSSNATLSGTLNSAPPVNDVLTLKFLAPDYSTQDGTLTGNETSIDKVCDYAVATVTVTAVDNETGVISVQDYSTESATTTANFVNQQAIIKFSLVDINSSALNATKLTVDVKYPITYNNVTVDIPVRSYTLSVGEGVYQTNNGTGIVYLAVPTDIPSQIEYNSQTIQIEKSNIKFILTATVGVDTYTLTKTGFTFENGKFYDITVKMKTPGYYAATNSDIGKVIGADLNIYDNVNTALAAGTTAQAMIAFLGNVEGVCTHGLAISLSDAYEYNVTYDQATGLYVIPVWASAHPITGGTWRLPSFRDWQYMLWGYYAESPKSTNISGFNSNLTTAGGTALGDNYFWTSTSVDTDNAKLFYFDGSQWCSFSDSSKAGNWRVRACLAF